jgi:GNAT superfamily N-acetyltransferase
VRIRRVGFRDGTDEELTAVHAVEAPIAKECGSTRMPQRRESYIAFARSLPSQFDDHAWLAEASDGTPIAVGFCWSNAAGDERVMECDVLVRQDRRRTGIGSRLLATISEETVSERRTLLTWSTFDAVPAGDGFSRWLGARVARINRTSVLSLSDADWAMVERWSSAARARDLGYSMEMVDGVFPEHLRDDAATLHHIMQTAPRENLDIDDVVIDVGFVAELDRALVQSGRTRWTLFVRDPEGACVGGTEITFEPEDPSTVLQQNTGVDPGHRGLGLAKWAKAAMLERIRDKQPEAQRIRTDNAFSNAPMLAINDALGFKITNTRTEWRADVGHIIDKLR